MKTLILKENIPSTSCENVSHYEVIEHNGKKFLIYIHAENGYPLGFNSNCCIRVMTSDGNWANVVDNRQIGYSYNQDGIYYSHDALTKRRIIDECVKEFKNYIKAVY